MLQVFIMMIVGCYWKWRRTEINGRIQASKWNAADPTTTLIESILLTAWFPHKFAVQEYVEANSCVSQYFYIFSYTEASYCTVNKTSNFPALCSLGSHCVWNYNEGRDPCLRLLFQHCLFLFFLSCSILQWHCSGSCVLQSGPLSEPEETVHHDARLSSALP